MTFRIVRRTRAMVVACIVVSLLGACGDRESKVDDVRAAIRGTKRAATSFVYSFEGADDSYTVTGVIADDFRFKALVSYDGAAGFEQIVYDDALAMRLHDPERLPELVDRDRVDSADLTTELEGANVLQVLNSKRWVLDAEGAPAVTTFGIADQELGKDPVYDALTSLSYVDDALTAAIEVVEYRADALNPVYPRTEDVFPKPESGSGVTRYDLRRGRLPSITQQGGAGGRQALPNVSHFRKMAIYVKGGRIIRVIERIEVIGKFIEDLHSYLETFVTESQLSDDLVNEFRAIERLGFTPEAGERYLDYLNKVLVGLGGDPIAPRVVSIEFTPGRGDATAVALPTADVVPGSLEVMLASRAAKTAEESVEDADAEPADGSEPAPLDPNDPTGSTETTTADGSVPTTVAGAQADAPTPPPG